MVKYMEIGLFNNVKNLIEKYDLIIIFYYICFDGDCLGS